jgi:hypothetical protein
MLTKIALMPCEALKRTKIKQENCVPHVDREGPILLHDSWAQLTCQEQEIIAGKILVSERQNVQQSFNVLINESGNMVEAILNVKNLIDSLGAHSNSLIWQQIDKIVEITGEGSLLHLRLGDRFLEAAAAAIDLSGNAEYVINDYWDKKLARHDYNTIRQTTQYSGLKEGEPAYPIHLANDLGGNRYFAHFDSTSPYFRSSRYSRWTPLYPILLIKERIEAARVHSDPNRRAPASRVRDYLRKIGKIAASEGNG